MSSHAITALATKRAELAGELEALERRAAELRQGLAHLDGAIRVFDPGYRTEGIRAKRPRVQQWFKPGELLRLCLDALREAGHPMTSRELGTVARQRRGHGDDARTAALVAKCVQEAMRRQVGRTVERVETDGQATGWVVPLR